MNMLNAITRICLSILVTLGEAVGRLIVPSHQLWVTHSLGVYGTRHWTHFHAYFAAPGWLFIEMGSWTIEASWRTRCERSRLKLSA
jgi:hypothetical protein